MKPPPPTEPVGELVWIGGQVDGVSVSLRFMGDDVNPDLITRLLRCRPTEARRKGDELPRPYYMVAKTGSWIFRASRTDEQNLEEQISLLLDRMSDDLQVWATVTHNCQADLFCGVFLKAWNRGFSLSPELLKRVADRHLLLDFDIYCAAEDVEDSEDGAT